MDRPYQVRPWRLALALPVVLLLAACRLFTPGMVTGATPTATGRWDTLTPAGTETPTRTLPAEASVIPAATGTPAVTTLTADPDHPEAAGAPYLDDRSTPNGVVWSYFNALNRREYLRAYSYWRESGPDSPVGAYEAFAAGYADTEAVQVTLGVLSGDAGAGQLYYTVPVVLDASTTSGERQVFSGCYILRLSNPGIQIEPPFIPLGIERAALAPAAPGADPASLLTSACTEPSIPLTPQPATRRDDTGPENYLDDRSDAVQVLRSLINAVNRKEYARAYAYWERGAGLPPFDRFAAGYVETESVVLLTGEARESAGAGQRYASVPVVLKARTTAGEEQTFAGCYRLHLANPSIQATPPFQPLAIESAEVRQVDPAAGTAALLEAACSP